MAFFPRNDIFFGTPCSSEGDRCVFAGGRLFTFYQHIIEFILPLLLELNTIELNESYIQIHYMLH